MTVQLGPRVTCAKNMTVLASGWLAQWVADVDSIGFICYSQSVVYTDSIGVICSLLQPVGGLLVASGWLTLILLALFVIASGWFAQIR